MAGWTYLPARAQVPALTKDSLVADQSRKQDRAVMMRIVVPSALLGVGVLAHSPACNQTLYRAKQEMKKYFRASMRTESTIIPAMCPWLRPTPSWPPGLA